MLQRKEIQILCNTRLYIIIFAKPIVFIVFWHRCIVVFLYAACTELSFMLRKLLVH